MEFGSVTEYGTLFYISIPCFAGGLFLMIKEMIHLWKKRWFCMEFVVLSAFIAVFVTSLPLDWLLIYRVNAIFFPMVYFITKFCTWLYQKYRKAFMVLGLIYLVLAGSFLQYYLFQFNDTHSLLGYFDNTFTGVAAHVKETFSEDTDIYFDSLHGHVMNPQIYLLEYYSPSPYEYQHLNDPENDDFCMQYDNIYFYFPESFDTEDVYLLSKSYLWQSVDAQNRLDADGFTYYEYGNYRVYYVPFYH